MRVGRNVGRNLSLVSCHPPAVVSLIIQTHSHVPTVSHPDATNDGFLPSHSFNMKIICGSSSISSSSISSHISGNSGSRNSSGRVAPAVAIAAVLGPVEATAALVAMAASVVAAAVVVEVAAAVAILSAAALLLIAAAVARSKLVAIAPALLITQLQQQ